MDTQDARALVGLTRERIGMKPALSSAKIEGILRAVPPAERRVYCLDLLASDPDGKAWQAFTEALLVHETYFFRHPDQLKLLADVLLPRLMQERLDAGRREVRVWCAGCSTGEEVYTLALLLQGAIARSAAGRGDAWSVTVLGTDVSAPTLERAREGTYSLVAGLNSFRDVPEFARHHFATIFSEAATRWSPGPDLRRLTRFTRHNLVTDPPAMVDADVVTCRNTLIYFDEAQSKAAVATLEAALRPGGALLLGPAETVSEAASLEMVCAAQAVFWTKRAAR